MYGVEEISVPPEIDPGALMIARYHKEKEVSVYCVPKDETSLTNADSIPLCQLFNLDIEIIKTKQELSRSRATFEMFHVVGQSARTQPESSNNSCDADLARFRNTSQNDRVSKNVSSRDELQRILNKYEEKIKEVTLKSGQIYMSMGFMMRKVLGSADFCKTEEDAQNKKRKTALEDLQRRLQTAMNACTEKLST
ncbi:unnamed protein product [Zymoseptoria tritici ST99CH_1E4]|uniref:Uncharacterized protein n=1 Tax=Zymoseptoria tritici ST99CH_1E4 TaxID=1276532 RepID=A0A2H1H940_ZYMTR|nr:unnamed protein product [Zymoseptoria tritici ST99CH_1E4]